VLALGVPEGIEDAMMTTHPYVGFSATQAHVTLMSLALACFPVQIVELDDCDECDEDFGEISIFETDVDVEIV
jgi:hypothetical protein